MIHILIPTTKERRTILDRCLNAIRENTEISHQIHIYENNDGGWVKATWNMITPLKDDTPILIINDDMLVHKGWDKMFDLWDGTNLVYPNNLIYDDLAAAWLCSVAFMKEHYHDGYIHHYADTEITEKAKLLNKLVYAKDCIIEHLHWTVNKSQMDETYKLVQRDAEKDRILFETRKKNGFYLKD
jgi:hypothetical protein